MNLDDKTATNLLIMILDIEDEPENILELDKWIEREGMEKVFTKVMEIEFAVNMKRVARKEFLRVLGKEEEFDKVEQGESLETSSWK